MTHEPGMRWTGVIVGLMLASTLSIAGGDLRHELLGTWQFDLAASRFDGGVPYDSGVARFTAMPSCIHVAVSIVEGRGRPLQFEYCDPGDGSYVATSSRVRPDGVPYSSVIVWRRIDD